MSGIDGKTLNRGEWAEFYVMLKLLGEGRLYTANKLLQKNYSSYLDILKIIRQETDDNVLDYIIDDASHMVTISIQDTNSILAVVPSDEFKKASESLFYAMNNETGITIPAPEDVCEFAKVIHVSKPKAPAVKALKNQFGGKNDIFIEVRDAQTSLISVMGFSIKSNSNSAPTLFNAGSSSQLLFSLNGCTDELMNEFNGIRSKDGKRGWADCKEFLKQNGITMEFTFPENKVFKNNLFLVRESMSTLLAWCYKDRLIGFAADFGVMETTARLAAANPLSVPNPEIYYEKAIKDFLMAGFTGMTAGTVWDGREQVNGGYIVVKNDGDVLCYHSNDREAFRDYLFRNTFFEYVSTEKYKWSFIKKINDEYYLPLNASIRFSKKLR